MAVLYLLMGLPGAGKTTAARQLEAEEGVLVLAPDPWMARIVGDGYDAGRRDAVKAVQMDLAAQLLGLGVDVALEFGFFSRAERDEARLMAMRAGAEARLIFLDPPFEVMAERLERRNAALPADTFPVTREHLNLCRGWLERPGVDEVLWRS